MLPRISNRSVSSFVYSSTTCSNLNTIISKKDESQSKTLCRSNSNDECTLYKRQSQPCRRYSAREKRKLVDNLQSRRLIARTFHIEDVESIRTQEARQSDLHSKKQNLTTTALPSNCEKPIGINEPNDCTLKKNLNERKVQICSPQKEVQTTTAAELQVGQCKTPLSAGRFFRYGDEMPGFFTARELILWYKEERDIDFPSAWEICPSYKKDTLEC